MALGPGTRLGAYEVLALIGAGGMGEVYRARDTKLNRDVALKVLPEVFIHDADRIARFKREAQVLASLNHPNIAAIYGLEESGSSTSAGQAMCAIVMELVDGPTLGEKLAGSGLPLDEALLIAKQIAAALEAAHDRGIVHRDLKPANLKVREDGVVKVLDFGLAKYEAGAAGSEALSTTLMSDGTGAGVVLGTAAYMSPEQARGQVVDKRTDIWAFGCVLYEMLAGRSPFARDTIADITSAILVKEPDWQILSGAIPAPIGVLLRRCLEKDRSRRLDSASAVRLEIDDGLSSMTRGAVEPATPSREERRPSIAVLPFANISADPENEYFSDGLAEEIINQLARIPGLKVIARTSAFSFKGKHEDVRRIAEALDVTNILEGSVRKAGNRIRVSAQLVAARDGTHLWVERYDRELADIFELQDEIARAIAGALQITLAGEPASSRRYIPAVPAYEAYLKARHQWAKATPEAMARYKDYLEQAIALDPGFALAYSELGEYVFSTFVWGMHSAHDAAPLARKFAQQALELDSSLPHAHAVMGMVAAMCDYDWTEADRRFRLAFAREPVPPQVRSLRANFFLAHVGRAQEAVEDQERLLQEDPLNILTAWTSAVSLRAARRDAEADARYRQIVESDQGFFSTGAAIALSGNHLERGEITEALRYAEQAYAQAPWVPAAVGQLAGMLGRTGQGERSKALVEELQPGTRLGAPFGLALCHLAAGELEQSADWLEKAIEQRDIWVPFFLRVGAAGGRVIWSSPRWPQLAKRLNVVGVA